jgi:hypothetical protein
MHSRFAQPTLTLALTILPIGAWLALVVASSGCSAPSASDEVPRELPRRAASARELAEYQWLVQLATRADGAALPLLQSDALNQVEVSFERDKMTVSGGLNAHSMGYRITGNRIVVKDQGMAMTVIGSSRERSILTDNALRYHLRPPFDYWLEGSGAAQRLHLIGADRTHLVLHTIDAAYGVKGESLSLEVAPQQQACRAAERAPMTDGCLKVRKLKWVNHMPQPASEWFALPRNAFDGQHPTPGQHQELKVRYYPSLTQGASGHGSYVVDQARGYDQIPVVETRGNTTYSKMPKQRAAD